MATKKIEKTVPPRPNVTNYLWHFLNFMRGRQTPFTFGRQYEDGQIYKILDAYVAANKLPTLRQEHQTIAYPEGVEDVTSYPRSTVCEPVTPGVVFSKTMKLLEQMPVDEWNKVVRLLVTQLRQLYGQRLINSNKELLNLEVDLKRRRTHLTELEQLLTGNY